MFTINEGFKLKLNSFSLIVHLYWVSYIEYELENEQVTLVESIKLSIKLASLAPYTPEP